MGELTESPKWIEKIYRIQKTDPVLGGQDGIINIQPEQIACRTLFLKGLLELEHSAEGIHEITDEQVADDAAIPEEKLVLDVSTENLAELLGEAGDRLAQLKIDVEHVLGENSFLVYGLARAAKLGWLYGEWGCEFEFFQDNLTMRDMKNIDARGIIGHDDSIDCADTTGFMPGMRLLVTNGEYHEEVTIRSILERGRIRLVNDLARTYDEPATIGYTDWDLTEKGKAIARKGFLYYSKNMTLLENCGLGTLLVCHEKGPGRLTVEVRDVGDNEGVWHEIEIVDTFPHDKDERLIYDRYEIRGASIQLKITGATDEPVVVKHLALFPGLGNLLPSSIRTPEVLYPEKDTEDLWEDFYALESSPFYTAYRDYYVQTEYGFFDPVTHEPRFVSTQLTNRMVILEDSDPAPKPGDYLLMCRHQSDMGEWSLWSSPVLVTIKPTRIYFGFVDAPKAGGFKERVPLTRLGIYPLHFGFYGARLSGGFDDPKIKFSSKLED